MQIQKKLLVISAISASIALSIAATRPGVKPAGDYKNLQVLPANISSKMLTKIMVDQFQDDLGVSCNFCHAENKDSHKPDYASDEKPEKEIARAMMRMTNGINEKYFGLQHAMVGDSVLAVSCETCHHGQAHPEHVPD